MFEIGLSNINLGEVFLAGSSSANTLIELSFSIAGSFILIAIWWYMFKSQTGSAKEIARYLFWWNVGSLAYTLTAFFVPLLGIFLIGLPLILLYWQVRKVHSKFSFIQKIAYTGIFAIAYFTISLVLAFFNVATLFVSISPTLEGVISTVFIVVSSFIVYYVMLNFVHPWMEKHV